ncbi:MAG: class I SAM-dependent RNA methyltransferase [Spirochaetaceae bacterium]|jgi:putative N6-adenine-specific DNA methylase|nr:class I SAM-dependent RNA methyltransferase [Spirochaetaceae bacterium]
MWIAVVLCALGAERVAANELKKLKLRVLDSGFGRVRFEADLAGLYRALMGLRTADRILLEAARFEARDFEELFEGSRGVPWEELIPRGKGLKVSKVRSNRSRLEAVTSIQGVVHKAAADRLCASYGLRRLPEEGDEAELRVYLEKDQVSLLLDLCGEPLFKRGYRSEGGAAPLRETTAAALLLLSGWKRKFPLYDPFCGSGTIPLEGAIYAWDMAPGIGRSFALSGLSLADRALERVIREELLAKVNFENTIRIYGSDADSRAVSQAKSNLVRAYELARGKNPQKGIRTGTPEGEFPGKNGGTSPLPDFRLIPLVKARSPDSEGFIITNPPYGKRVYPSVISMGDHPAGIHPSPEGRRQAAEAIYREMGVLAKNFPGWKLGIITDHPGFESHFGRKADSLREITNGAIPSYFYEYHHL